VAGLVPCSWRLFTDKTITSILVREVRIEMASEASGKEEDGCGGTGEGFVPTGTRSLVHAARGHPGGVSLARKLHFLMANMRWLAIRIRVDATSTPAP
jgi:hypothetical protein